MARTVGPTCRSPTPHRLKAGIPVRHPAPLPSSSAAGANVGGAAGTAFETPFRIVAEGGGPRSTGPRRPYPATRKSLGRERRALRRNADLRDSDPVGAVAIQVGRVDVEPVSAPPFSGLPLWLLFSLVPAAVAVTWMPWPVLAVTRLPANVLPASLFRRAFGEWPDNCGVVATDGRTRSGGVPRRAVFSARYSFAAPAKTQVARHPFAPESS